MKVTRALGKAIKPFVNVTRWVGWDQVAAEGKNIVNMAKDLIKVKAPETHAETFEQAVIRLNLTEDDIQKRRKSLLMGASVYLLFAFALLIYAFYLFIWSENFLAGLLALIVAGLALAFTYREHFWYFQMTVRRLGCSFKDWVSFTFRGVK